MAEKIIKNKELESVIRTIAVFNENGQPVWGLMYEKLKGNDPTATKRKLKKIREQLIAPYQEYVKELKEIAEDALSKVKKYPENYSEEEKKEIDAFNEPIMEALKQSETNLGEEIGHKLDILNPIPFESLQLAEDSKIFYDIDFLGKLICDDYTDIVL